MNGLVSVSSVFSWAISLLLVLFKSNVLDFILFLLLSHRKLCFLVRDRSRWIQMGREELGRAERGEIVQRRYDVEKKPFSIKGEIF